MKGAVAKRLFCNSPYRYRALWPRRYKLRFRYVLRTRYALRGMKERYPIEFGKAEYIEAPWSHIELPEAAYRPAVFSVR